MYSVFACAHSIFTCKIVFIYNIGDDLIIVQSKFQHFFAKEYVEERG